MTDFKVNIGYVGCTKQSDGKVHKPFALDLSKFPVLFIDYNNTLSVDEDMEDITRLIMTKCISFRPKDRVKTVVLDRSGVAYNSIVKPGTYKQNDAKTMLKHINTIVSRIYEEYMKDPYNFMPHTRYIILVCRIDTMEKELLSLISKLGRIGVYLIFADDASKYNKLPHLFTNLYGQITCIDFQSLENKPEIKYDIDYPHKSELKLPVPECVYNVERLTPYYAQAPLIYSGDFVKEFYETVNTHKEWEAF